MDNLLSKVQAKPRIKCNCGRKTDFKGKKHVFPHDVHVFTLINHAPSYADVKGAVTLNGLVARVGLSGSRLGIG